MNEQTLLATRCFDGSEILAHADTGYTQTALEWSEEAISEWAVNPELETQEEMDNDIIAQFHTLILV